MIFLDTEFTCLSSPALLSFAMVALGGHEIYAELDLAQDPIGQERLRAASKFTRDIVITQFGQMPKSRCWASELGERAGQWLLARSADARGPVKIAFDYEGDFILLRSAMEFAGVWARLEPMLVAENIGRISKCAEGARAAEASWLESSLYRGIGRHHALADAIALRSAWRAVCGG